MKPKTCFISGTPSSYFYIYSTLYLLRPLGDQSHCQGYYIHVSELHTADKKLLLIQMKPRYTLWRELVSAISPVNGLVSERHYILSLLRNKENTKSSFFLGVKNKTVVMHCLHIEYVTNRAVSRCHSKYLAAYLFLTKCLRFVF